jgi:hypothetical protein
MKYEGSGDFATERASRNMPPIFPCFEHCGNVFGRWASKVLKEVNYFSIVYSLKWTELTVVRFRWDSIAPVRADDDRPQNG